MDDVFHVNIIVGISNYFESNYFLFYYLFVF